MEFVYLILGLAILGFLAYLVITYIPMPEPIKQTIVVIIVILMVLFVLTKLLPVMDVKLFH